MNLNFICQIRPGRPDEPGMIQDQTGYNQINPDHGEVKIFLL